jgi:PhoPQ-activated pathogenicity-related protein
MIRSASPANCNELSLDLRLQIKPIKRYQMKINVEIQYQMEVKAFSDEVQHWYLSRIVNKEAWGFNQAIYLIV